MPCYAELSLKNASDFLIFSCTTHTFKLPYTATAYEHMIDKK